MGDMEKKENIENIEKKPVRKDGQRKTNGTKKRPAKRPEDAKAVKKKKPVSGKTRPQKAAEAGNGKRKADGENYDREAVRAKRREERRRKVRRQKIILSSSCAVIAVCAVVLIVLFTPSLRLSRALAKGSEYVQAADYQNAQVEYERALDIDATSVKAYRGLAENYLAQKNAAEAESKLYLGWENTQDESLLNYYCTVVLNEAVAQINDKNVTLSTMDKCIQILEINAQNADALSLTDTCYQRFFHEKDSEEVCRVFYDETAQEGCQYEEYAGLVSRLLEVCRANPSEEMKTLLKEYALVDTEWVWIGEQHADSYKALLNSVNEVLADEQIKDAVACLEKSEEVEGYFAEAFTQFAAGNYEYARDIVSSEEYMALRDCFIQENSGYWEGSIYIPVNQKGLVLHRTENGYRFSFTDDEEGEPTDVITVWGSKQEDDGVQRSVISFEPAAENDATRKTEYTIQYLYSNVKINGQYVPQMNYRFDTKVTTDEGTTTTAIGDWGGEHEWEIDY